MESKEGPRPMTLRTEGMSQKTQNCHWSHVWDQQIFRMHSWAVCTVSILWELLVDQPLTFRHRLREITAALKAVMSNLSELKRLKSQML